MLCAQSGDHESNAERRSDKQSLFISTDDIVRASSVVTHVQGQRPTVHSINKGFQVGRWDVIRLEKCLSENPNLCPLFLLADPQSVSRDMFLYKMRRNLSLYCKSKTLEGTDMWLEIFVVVKKDLECSLLNYDIVLRGGLLPTFLRNVYVLRI
jgi:hypothetical protein